MPKAGDTAPVCPNCGQQMEDLGVKNLRFGGAAGIGGMLLGGLNQLSEQLFRVQVYRCPDCRKLDFYDAD